MSTRCTKPELPVEVSGGIVPLYEETACASPGSDQIRDHMSDEQPERHLGGGHRAWYRPP